MLSAGTIASPQLLMLSGIGPAGHLRQTGIPVRLDLPGVGANLHDHPMALISYGVREAFVPGPGRPMILTRSAPGSDPDVQLSFSPAALEPQWSGRREGFTVFFAVVAPASRGSIRLRDADPASYPLIDPAYLSAEADMDRMATGLRMARDIARAGALRGWRGDELYPGPAVASDEECRAYIRRATSTYFHPAGTCRIGTDDHAVVDTDLRVRGIDGLRVADASVMPSVVSANTNAAVLGIAERAAHLISTSAG